MPKQFSPDFCRWNPSFLGDLGGHPCLTKTLACSERWRFLHPDAGHGTSWHFRYGNEAMPLRTHPDPPVSSAPWLRISSGGSNGKMGGSPSSHVRFPEGTAGTASRLGGFNPSSKYACHWASPSHFKMVGKVVETSTNTWNHQWLVDICPISSISPFNSHRIISPF